MACSAVGLSPRMYLSPPSLPGKSRYTSQTSGVPNASLSSKDSPFYRRRKGFLSEFGGLLSSSKGFHLRAFPAPLSGYSRRMTYLLAYSRLGGSQKMLYYFREASSYVDDLHGAGEQSSFRRLGKKGLTRRGLKRTLSACNQLCSARKGESRTSCWDDQNLFGKMPSKASPFAARKKLRCWNEEGDAGEPPPNDKTALEALEQAIQFQVKEETRLFFGGPARGDLAEVEAFCRLYRHADQLQSAVMNALRTHSTTVNLESQKTPATNRGDVSEVEEKVASGLAHLMALLHESKDDVLGGRTIRRDNPGEEVLSADGLPPFAQLRKKVRACCSTLEDALESLVPEIQGSQQGLVARERMLKLKNACLDAGFPRPEGVPSPADIPNLAPVRLRPSKSARTLYKDENVAFWRGGHFTEAGLSWLVEKGFKTIVDLREGSAQPIARSSLPDAVASGKLKVVRMPVERGSAPSKEQVEEFARLVADAVNKPLYLHTRAGVHRASAMVSKWREAVLREQLQIGPVKKGSPRRTLSRDLELLRVDDAVTISPEDALALENATQRIQNGRLSVPGNASNGNGTFSTDSDSGESDNVPTFSGDKALTPVGVVQDGEVNANGSVQDDVNRFDVTKNAFEAQRPIPEILSRTAMSKFMKRRKVPSGFFSNRRDRPFVSSSLSSKTEAGVLNGNIAGPANRWTPKSPGIPRADPSEVSRRQTQPADVFSGPVDGGYDKLIVTNNGNSRVESDAVIAKTEEPVDQGERRNIEYPARLDYGSLYTAAGEKLPTEEVEEQVTVDGDMCASTTGVVRLQSRKKAEMFLVRTDGYSCTRERVKESTLAFTHPSTQQQMLMWKTPPRTVLLLKKLGSELTKETQEVANFLYHQEGMNVMVEPDVHDGLARLPGFGFIQTFYNQNTTELHERVDFVVCLGGDGVILHASNLFRNAVPPVVSFNLGSLGFLTSHTFSGHKKDLQAVIHGHNDMMTGVYITLRMRLRCELYRNGRAVPGKVFDVLNEVVVDRGSSPYLCKIECYERNRLITKVQADGVIVATPTGSTAYSIAAGGSMVHPNVPCMLFTPICPHSLSFRPVILPDSALLELRVPNDARSNAWASFDGKRRQQLSKGDSVRICMSEHPLPTVNKSDQTDDWFQSLVRCLNWNERLEQRPLST